MTAPVTNAFSVDLEDWFCVKNLSSIIPFASWDAQELRVERSTERLLALFREYNVRATFFVLGWIAERCPDLVRRIADEGHEIAAHGYAHETVKNLTTSEFREDLQKALEVVRPLVNAKIIGYRAASFSVSETAKDVFGVLSQNGILYDSSIFPFSFHPDYGGHKQAPLSPYEIHDGLTEFPMSCFRFLGVNLPCCGGGYFRLLPYWYTSQGIRRCNSEGRPVVFYIHPWEIDPDQQRLKLSPVKAFRHYFNLSKTEDRLRRLFTDFRFDTVSSVLELS